MKNVGFVKVVSVSAILSLMTVVAVPLFAIAAPTDSVSPKVAIISPSNGSTVSGSVAISANASDVFSSCVVTIFNKKYDVTSLQSSHPGGNIFVCGTDMTTTYQGMHGNDLGRMTPYAIPASYTGVTRVDFYVDGSLVATDNTVPFSYVWNTANISNGNHTIQVKASDGKNTGASSLININVTNQNTTATINQTPNTTTTSNATDLSVSTILSTPISTNLHQDDEDNDVKEEYDNEEYEDDVKISENNTTEEYLNEDRSEHDINTQRSISGTESSSEDFDD